MKLLQKNVLGGNKLNCFNIKTTQVLGGLTKILIWGSEIELKVLPPDKLKGDLCRELWYQGGTSNFSGRLWTPMMSWFAYHIGCFYWDLAVATKSMNRSFTSKDLILTNLFIHQTWVTQITLHNLLQGNKPYMQHTNGAEFNLWYFVPSISLKKQSADAFVADSW